MEFRFERPKRIIIGTVGLPGEREFFLQVSDDSAHYSFAIEKAQAAALAERMREILREMKRRDPDRFQSISSPVEPDDESLTSPVEADFRVGEMSLIWMDDAARIVLEATSAEETQPGSVEIHFTLGQASEFIRRTERVVSAGRAPCPFCGLPLNIDGHLCPRANGYRR